MKPTPILYAHAWLSDLSGSSGMGMDLNFSLSCSMIECITLCSKPIYPISNLVSSQMYPNLCLWDMISLLLQFQSLLVFCRWQSYRSKLHQCYFKKVALSAIFPATMFLILCSGFTSARHSGHVVLSCSHLITEYISSFRSGKTAVITKDVTTGSRHRRDKYINYNQRHIRRLTT